MFINKKENFNKKEGIIIFNSEKYSKKFFFRKRRHSSKKTFTNFFKYYSFYKKKISKNVNLPGLQRPDLSIIPSLHYSRIRFKTYKNTLLTKKLKSSNLFSGVGINKNSNTYTALEKSYFTKKKLYVNRLNFLNKFNQVPGKKRYKSPFYYTFKYLQNFTITNANKNLPKTNSSRPKDLFSSRRFDWILVLTTTNTNMYVNLTNLKGETVFYHTLRRVGFQTGGSSKRSSKVAVEKLGIFVGKFLKKKKFSKKSFLVIFKGLSWKKRFILKYIKAAAAKIKFSAIFERTGLAHNGCKLKKRKHKRRSFLKLHWLKKKLRIRKFKKIFKGLSRKKLLFKFNKYASIVNFKQNLNLKFFAVPKFFWKRKDFKRNLLLERLRSKKRDFFLFNKKNESAGFNSAINKINKRNIKIKKRAWRIPFWRRIGGKYKKTLQSENNRSSDFLKKRQTPFENYFARFAAITKNKNWKKRKAVKKKNIAFKILYKNVKFKK